MCFSLLLPLSSWAKPDGSTLLACPSLRVPLQSTTTKLIEKTLENGLDAKIYDTTGDGKPDVVTYSVPGADLPLFYEVDEDRDNGPDKLYIDPERNGKCVSIKLYNDYTIPGHNEPNPDSFPKWIVEGM